MESEEKALRRQKEREEEARASLNRKADSIVEDARRRLRNLVGRKTYDEFRAAILSERLALRELRQPPEGLKRDFRMDQRAGKKRVDALLRKHGVSADKVMRIHNDTREKLREILAPPRGDTGPGYSLANHHDTWLDLTGVDPNLLAPPEDDPNDPHRWFWFVPPYSNSYHNGIRYGDEGFHIDWKTFGTRGGLIGSELSCDIYDVGQGDIAYPHTLCEIEFMIRMPVIGPLEIVVRAQCLRDFYEASFVDEFGFSWATVYQENSLYLFIFKPPYERSAKVMSFNETTSDDPPVMGDKLIPGNHYYAHFTNNGIVGTAPYRVRIGSINFARVFADDMAVRCRSICLWQIQSVGVRIAP